LFGRRDGRYILVVFVGPDNNDRTEFGVAMAIAALLMENKKSEVKRVGSPAGVL
jgi:hypothetical protein